MPLSASLHISPPIPITSPTGTPLGLWSPITSTLLHTRTHAVLVDTPITISQTSSLISWITATLHPGAVLKYIYITHGHGDHWFGLNMLLRHFKGCRALATKETIEHMRSQISEDGAGNAATGRGSWESRFPGGQIDTEFVLAEPLPDSLEFSIPSDDKTSGADEIQFHAIQVGHSDTHDSTVLFVPSLKLVVAGDVVYGDVHQMLAEANTHALRMEWVKAIDTVASLKPTPEIVVPGHMKAGEVPGVWHLERSRRYILDFDRLMQRGGTMKVKEVVGEMKRLWPTRFNDGALVVGAVSSLKERERGMKAKGKGGKL